MSLRARLSKVEAQWPSEPSLDPAAEERKARYVALWEQLLTTMAEEHVWHLVDAWEGRHGGTPCHLLSAAEHLVQLALRGEQHFRLALPAPVAAAYIARGGSPYDRCEDCHLGIPYTGAYSRGGVPVPAWHAFARCPDCGGRVRFYDYGRWVGNETHRGRHDPPAPVASEEVPG
jgi:hypothetical protein